MNKRLSLFLCILAFSALSLACGSVQVSFGLTPVASDGAGALSTPAVSQTSPASDGAGALSTPSGSPTPFASDGADALSTPSGSPTPRDNATQVPAAFSTPVSQSSGNYKTIVITALPSEARTTLKLIAAHGLFPYRQDGVVFQNREGVLPKKGNGYYHEYTVVTPGSADRGTRRIIAGSQGELYYTDDHYVTFRLIIVQ